MITYLSLKITHESPIKDLASHVENRVYALVGGNGNVECITDFPAVNEPAEALPNGHGSEAP